MAESQKKTRVVLSCPKLNMSKVFLCISMYFYVFPCVPIRKYYSFISMQFLASLLAAIQLPG